MKKNKLLFVATLSAACLFSLASCQGAQGPKGDQGEPGINGTNGTNGINGTNGSSVLTGKGVPASSLGSDGDSYIDTDTFDFYSKKSGAWSKIGNIKGSTGEQGSQGEQGEEGKKGTSLLSGSGVPSSDLGSDGDSYIDTTTFDFYSKSNGEWKKYGNFKGQDGSKGEDGTKGEDGKTGTSVLTGTGEPASTLGNDGDSYIDTSSFDFYTKADGTWSKVGNIKGEKGDQGDKGDKGNTGWSGSKGDKGDTAYSNTILPSDGGYITVDVGSALVNTTVEFSFEADSSHYLESYTFDGWKTSEVPDVVQTKGQKITVSKQMIAGGFVVAAKFTTVEPAKPIQNNTDAGDDASTSGQSVSGNVAIVNTNTTADVSLNATGDVTITKGEMKGSTSETTTPVLDIKASDATAKTVTIASGVTISNYDLKLEDNVTLVIEEGANVTFNDVELKGTSKIVGSYKKVNQARAMSLFATSNEDTMSYDIVGNVTIEKGATLENVAIKGIITVKGTTGDFVMKDCYYQASGARTENAYLKILTTDKVSITGCEFHLDNGETDDKKKVYNFIEFGYSTVVNTNITISDNEFDCTNMTHNVINMYKFSTSAESKIDLTNNKYKNGDFTGTQPVRISNSNKSSQKIEIDISGSSLNNFKATDGKEWDTFILFQADNTDESYANVTLTAKNMSIGTIGTDLIISSDKIAYYNKLLVVYYKEDNSSLTVPEVVLDENINTKAFETLTISTKTEKNDQDKDETIVTLGSESEFTFENKVIKDAIGKLKLSDGQNIKFTNCVFINPSLQIYAYGFNQETTIEFENCKFIGNTGANSIGAVMIDGNHHIKASFKGCTFTNTKRAINTQFRQSSTLDSSVTIEGCTFNGVTDEKYAALQVTNDSTVVTFKNNTINGLGNAACIVRFHGNWTTYNDTTLSNVTFEGNTVNSTIKEEKYLDLDGKEKDQDTFYKAALTKFKIGLKTK